MNTRTLISWGVNPEISQWHRTVLTKVCLSMIYAITFNLINKTHKWSPIVFQLLIYLFPHLCVSFLQGLAGGPPVSSWIQAYTSLPSMIYPKGENSRSRGGKSSPETLQRQLWKNLFLHPVLANGFTKMQIGSLLPLTVENLIGSKVGLLFGF